MRSWVVRRLAHIYIERHVADLADRPGVLRMHKYMRQATIEASLKKHVDGRVAQCYPEEEYGSAEGGIMPDIPSMVRAQQTAGETKSTESAFDMKQSTMHDLPESDTTIFKHVRPSIVTDDASTSDTLHEEVIAEYALKSISSLTIKMSNKVENQFISKYTSRIFPWALNYDCGGADYPNLFSD